jgi:hypothetical protein
MEGRLALPTSEHRTTLFDVAIENMLHSFADHLVMMRMRFGISDFVRCAQLVIPCARGRRRQTLFSKPRYAGQSLRAAMLSAMRYLAEILG